jgi:hypothetical protein
MMGLVANGERIEFQQPLKPDPELLILREKASLLTAGYTFTRRFAPGLAASARM